MNPGLAADTLVAILRKLGVGGLLHFLIFLMGLGMAFSQIRRRTAATGQG